MSEPTLNTISDYNGLEGEKKKTVWLVVVSGILMTLGYIAVDSYLGDVNDKIVVTDSVKILPSK